MTVYYGDQMTKLRNTTPRAAPSVSLVGGRLRTWHEHVTLATQTTSDTIEVGWLQKGSVFQYGLLLADTSLGSTTVAIGITGTTGKYRTAATFTTTNQPVLFGNLAASGVALTADEIIFLTLGAASLPGSGSLDIMFFYTID